MKKLLLLCFIFSASADQNLFLSAIDREVKELAPYFPSHHAMHRDLDAIKKLVESTSNIGDQVSYLNNLKDALKILLLHVSSEFGNELRGSRTVQVLRETCAGHKVDSLPIWFPGPTKAPNEESAYRHIEEVKRNKCVSCVITNLVSVEQKSLSGVQGLRLDYEYFHMPNFNCSNKAIKHVNEVESKSTESLRSFIHQALANIDSEIALLEKQKQEKEISSAVEKAVEGQKKEEMRRILANIITLDRKFANQCMVDETLDIDSYLKNMVDQCGSLDVAIAELENIRSRILKDLAKRAESMNQTSSGIQGRLASMPAAQGGKPNLAHLEPISLSSFSTVSSMGSSAQQKAEAETIDDENFVLITHHAANADE